MGATPVATYAQPDGPLGEPTGWRARCEDHGWLGFEHPHTPEGETMARAVAGYHNLTAHLKRGLASAVVSQ